MFFGDFEGVQELSDSLKACEDGILPAKGMFSEENLKGGLILVFVGLEVSKRAGKLIEIVVENIDVIALSSFHLFCLSLIIPVR